MSWFRLIIPSASGVNVGFENEHYTPPQSFGLPFCPTLDSELQCLCMARKPTNDICRFICFVFNAYCPEKKSHLELWGSSSCCFITSLAFFPVSPMISKFLKTFRESFQCHLAAISGSSLSKSFHSLKAPSGSGVAVGGRSTRFSNKASSCASRLSRAAFNPDSGCKWRFGASGVVSVTIRFGNSRFWSQ